MDGDVECADHAGDVAGGATGDEDVGDKGASSEHERDDGFYPIELTGV